MKAAFTALTVCLATLSCHGEELSRRCLQGDCVVLLLEEGKLFAERTGEFAGKREIGNYDSKGASLVPKTEAPIRFSKTQRGWTAIVTAYLPEQFDFDAPELRLYLFDPSGKRAVVDDNYNLLGDFKTGKILNTGDEFALISSTGAHAYVVRTSAWFLPTTGPPKHVLVVSGLLVSIRESNAGPPGLLIDRQTYDGVHAETKGTVKELYVWSAETKTLTLQTK
jgi:hypothetical protein